MVNSLFDFLVYYLPVFVPMFLVVFSVLTRILSGGMPTEIRSFLKTYTDVVLGIFSFQIWALITYSQTGRIGLNDDLVISFPKFIILFIFDLVLLVGAAQVARYEWTQELSLGSRRLTPAGLERLVDSSMLMLTLSCFVLPIFIASNLSVKSQNRGGDPLGLFKVAIPYEDPSLARHVGEAKWGNRVLCKVRTLSAGSSTMASEVALSDFGQSAASEVMYSRLVPEQKVNILADSITVQGECAEN